MRIYIYILSDNPPFLTKQETALDLKEEALTFTYILTTIKGRKFIREVRGTSSNVISPLLMFDPVQRSGVTAS
jgi:hypothetical protein